MGESARRRMIRTPRGRRSRFRLPDDLRAGLVLLVAALLVPTPTAAQVPPTPDPDEEVEEELDEVAATDTVPRRPLVVFPDMPLSPDVRYAAGEWVWDQEALLREAPTSLIDLLGRIPGVNTFRAGMFVQPEAAAGFGGTLGRVEIEVDGYILDPLAGSTFDLAQLPLTQIRELRVQRRLGLLRIRISTAAPATDQPLTRIEAGIGVPPANLFRGIFLAPHVVVGPLGAAIERLDTDGTGRVEPANIFSGWAKWSWTDGDRGVQLELLRTTTRRLPNSPWLTDRSRQDIVVRARNRFAPGITAELFAGRSVLDETPARPAGDTIPVTPLERSSVQAGGRAVLQLPELTVGASLRYRDAQFLPRLEAGIDADVHVGPVRVGGELRHASWADADATFFHNVHGELAVVGGAAVFAEVTGGRRGAPAFAEDAASSIITHRTGWRAGLTVALGSRATGSAAVVNLEQDMAHPFGLPFDTAAVAHASEAARGIEASGRFVIVPGWLAIESWITDWNRAVGWTYLPVRTWRTALELHALPLPTGNLEILGRMEATQRGTTLVYQTQPGAEESAGSVAIPGYTRLDGYLQIRVIDVRAFIRWEDVTGQQIMDLPGRFHRGPRIFYGVKWNLWN